MTENSPSQDRALTLPGLLAAALAVIAVVVSIIGLVSEIPSLGLIAAAIATRSGGAELPGLASRNGELVQCLQSLL